MNDYPQEFLDYLHSITAKRPRTVIEHILRHGHITSEELKEIYGYNHPPRAIRDVRELNIPIVTYRIRGKDGRSIAAYKLGTPGSAADTLSKSSGRTALSKSLKKALINKYGSKCFIYLETMDESSLQVDHRIPYEIGGEQDERDVDCYMLLSPSANRAKSWTCEHCSNWEKKDADFCLHCFWAHPENYEHVAGRQERVVTLVFTGNEIDDYEKLVQLSGEDAAQETIKRILHQHLK